MKIKDWPSEERPQEKLLSSGPESLSNAELLAILFCNGTKNRSAVDLGRELLNKFCDLRTLFCADRDIICKFPGIGLTKYARLQAAIEISRRYLYEQASNKVIIRSGKEMKDYLIAELAHLHQEVFGCFFLNKKQEIICFQKLFFGSIDRAEIYPREIIRKALSAKAAYVILTHNHPSGGPSPSNQDVLLTQRLSQALKSADIDILDHIIIGAGKTVSLAEIGLLATT